MNPFRRGSATPFRYAFFAAALSLFGLLAALAAPALAAASPLEAELALSLCQPENVLRARPRLCNASPQPTLFQVQFAPLPAGPYLNGTCTFAGPTSFVLAEAQPVLVSADSCVDLHLAVARPAGMTEGEISCFAIEAEDLTSGEIFESHSFVSGTGEICGLPLWGSSTGVPSGRQVPMTFTVFNKLSQPRLFDYRFESTSSDGGPSVVSLDGGLAGVAVSGQVVIPAAGEAQVSVAVTLDESLPPVRQDLLLRDRDSSAVLASRGMNAYRPGCAADDSTLCLNQERFEVRVMWRDFEGLTGVGHGGGLTGDTGYFWFFSPDNIEVVVKVLDGRHINEKWWVFFGALSTVEYTVTVRDTVTGESKSYNNPSGLLASVGDISALPGYEPVPISFPTLAGSSPKQAGNGPLPVVLRPLALGDCVDSSTVFCVQGGRFQVEVTWTTLAAGNGNGKAVVLTGETGYFWFFSPENVELVVKVLDGRGINGHWWVFFGALSDVEYTLKVTDTLSGEEKIFHNPQGHLASIADLEAFTD